MKRVRKQGRRAILGLATGAAALGIAAGTAGIASAATTSAAAPRIVRPVACRTWTFNVYHGAQRTCFEGKGAIRVFIQDVTRITTGENTGFFDVFALGAAGGGYYPPGHFRPHEVISFRRPGGVVLTLIDITHN
jgi:hypothetical protein